MGDPIFAGTADYYSRYRPRYPAALLSDLVEQTVGDHGTSLVDLGCGTGEVTLSLSSVFDQVTAVDVDPGMIEVATRKAGERGIGNVRFLIGRAEDLELAEGRHDLIAAGSSFHWMDRELLARRCYRSLTDDGSIAVLGGGSDVWEVRTEWHEIALRVVKKHLGDRRRAGSGTYTTTDRHEDYLEPAGFTVESRDYPVDHVWSADEIVGFLYSTSFASHALLGARRAEFEADLRAELHSASPDDAFHETLLFHLMIGRK